MRMAIKCISLMDWCEARRKFPRDMTFRPARSFLDPNCAAIYRTPLLQLTPFPEGTFQLLNCTPEIDGLDIEVFKDPGLYRIVVKFSG